MGAARTALSLAVANSPAEDLPQTRIKAALQKAGISMDFGGDNNFIPATLSNGKPGWKYVDALRFSDCGDGKKESNPIYQEIWRAETSCTDLSCQKLLVLAGF